MRRIKQPTTCDSCGGRLMYGSCGKGYCPNCKTYVMSIEVDFEHVSFLEGSR
jgi:uncharacterized Zn finger protein (UPF0148 family)